MKETKQKVERKPRDNSQDTNILLACMLKELEDFSKYVKFIAEVKANEHGIDLKR